MPTPQAEKIFNALNNSTFRRCQPYAGDDRKAMEIIDQCIAEKKPIPIMMYWGKAERDNVEEPERLAIAYLADNLEKVSAIYKQGIELKVVFVDTHVKFNGLDVTQEYLDKTRQAFEEGFAKRNGLKVSMSLASQHLPFTATKDGKGFEEFDRLKDLAGKSDIATGVAQTLAPRAEHYYRRTNDTPEIAGTMYYELCKLEQEPMGAAFKDHIFLTYNNAVAGGKKHFGVPAGMPAICANSLPGGITDKPWNMEPEKLRELLAAKHIDTSHILPACELINPERKPMNSNKSLAVVGGGLAGLMSAYQAIETDPSLAITVYEKGSKESYMAGDDDSHRASLSGSTARTIRLSGAGEGVGEWNVRETKRVIDALQAELDLHPADYPGLEGRKLFHPEAVVIIPASKEDKGYKKILAGLKKNDVACSELTGAELKQRFPGIYNTVPDNAAAVIEEPFNADTNRNGAAGVMDTQAIMQVLRTVLEKRGAKIRYGDGVQSIDDAGEGVNIKSAQGEASYDHAILAPGQWLETLKNNKGQSITQQYDIKPRYERVVVMDIDFNALGLNPSRIPFTKGLAPKGGEGTFYSHEPDSTNGHVKFFPAIGTRSVDGTEALHQPITDAEKEEAFNAASIRFNVSAEALKAHTRFSGCAYTGPKISEKMLVAPLGKHMTFVGLDSSGSARVSGGLGRIAANLALGRDEPHQGANAAFSLEEHYKLVNGGTVLNCAHCRNNGTCQDPRKTTGITVGGK